MKDRCENCLFWKPEDFPGEPEDFGIGLCLRFPPVLSKDEALETAFDDGFLGKEAFFPITQHNISCGEHKPKPKGDESGTTRKE